MTPTLSQKILNLLKSLRAWCLFNILLGSFNIVCILRPESDWYEAQNLITVILKTPVTCVQNHHHFRSQKKIKKVSNLSRKWLWCDYHITYLPVINSFYWASWLTKLTHLDLHCLTLGAMDRTLNFLCELVIKYLITALEPCLEQS